MPTLAVGATLSQPDEPGRAPPRLPEAADVAVVGAGLIGLSVAWRLAAAGLSVAVLDRGAAGAGARNRRRRARCCASCRSCC